MILGDLLLYNRGGEKDKQNILGGIITTLGETKQCYLLSTVGGLVMHMKSRYKE